LKYTSIPGNEDGQETWMARQFDLAVIGGGSGGLALSKRAAEHGARAVVIEAGRIGGTCVNVGCVPKKVMWNAANTAHALHDAPDYGFDLDLSGHDWAALKSSRDAYVERLNGVHLANLERHGVDLIRGYGRLTGPVSPGRKKASRRTAFSISRNDPSESSSPAAATWRWSWRGCSPPSVPR
jgi:pyruvate/2-oxoglutarate dehydrogenase complex dihydrolipoamide dehydrogenase (E3) component